MSQRWKLKEIDKKDHFFTGIYSTLAVLLLRLSFPESPAPTPSTLLVLSQDQGVSEYYCLFLIKYILPY